MEEHSGPLTMESPGNLRQRHAPADQPRSAGHGAPNEQPPQEPPPRESASSLPGSAPKVFGRKTDWYQHISKFPPWPVTFGCCSWIIWTIVFLELRFSVGPWNKLAVGLCHLVATSRAIDHIDGILCKHEEVQSKAEMTSARRSANISGLRSHIFESHVVTVVTIMAGFFCTSTIYTTLLWWLYIANFCYASSFYADLAREVRDRKVRYAAILGHRLSNLMKAMTPLPESEAATRVDLQDSTGSNRAVAVRSNGTSNDPAAFRTLKTAFERRIVALPCRNEREKKERAAFLDSSRKAFQHHVSKNQRIVRLEQEVKAIHASYQGKIHSFRQVKQALERGMQGAFAAKADLQEKFCALHTLNRQYRDSARDQSQVADRLEQEMEVVKSERDGLAEKIGAISERLEKVRDVLKTEHRKRMGAYKELQEAETARDLEHKALAARASAMEIEIQKAEEAVKLAKRHYPECAAQVKKLQEANTAIVRDRDLWESAAKAAINKGKSLTIEKRMLQGQIENLKEAYETSQKEMDEVRARSLRIQDELDELEERAKIRRRLDGWLHMEEHMAPAEDDSKDDSSDVSADLKSEVDSVLAAGLEDWQVDCYEVAKCGEEE